MCPQHSQSRRAHSTETELHQLRRIVQADAPSRPIACGLARPALLPHVLVSKYSDHLPLYRQSEIYAREGLELERSTLANWVGATSELLKPLDEALRQYVLSARKLHADDTPVPVLAPGQGKTKQGRLWTYVGTIAQPVTRLLRQSGLLTRRIAGESIHTGISPTSRARSRRMHMPASTGYMTVAAFRRQPAGRVSGASFLTCMRHMHHRLQPKRWNGSARYMRRKRDSRPFAG